MARRRRRRNYPGQPRNSKGRFVKGSRRRSTRRRSTRRRSTRRRSTRRRSTRRRSSGFGLGKILGGRKIMGARPVFWLMLLGVGVWAWQRKQKGLPLLPGMSVA